MNRPKRCFTVHAPRVWRKQLARDIVLAGNSQLKGVRVPAPALTAASPLSHPDIFERLRRIPSGEEPAFWPVRVITELEYVTDPGEQPDSPLTQKWAPVRESLRRVKKAYEILAYPHVKYDGWRECIQAELERSRQLHGIDQVELDDAELHILGKPAATAEVPFDPRKRVYSYSEVPLPPYIDPFGRRHMSTEQIRSELTEKED